ncbi:uncharacterized protein LOC125235898 isoform X2 [Leguminivora glycinivorella]|uniref:uncharacterized protein LOC125235898 isoform X2 n=1 Tax=Leguminivora glycinivorella TaxID=1035111 RepID=UPI0020104B3E|nr:uncharacterized protein LOC125235898 isoform X2 [Leguminivora glycinivorella]
MLYLLTIFSVTDGVTNNSNKHSVDWWCDEIECYYSDKIPGEETCHSNKSIPYRFNSTTGTCELNLIGLLLSFKVLSNRLGAVVEENNRMRSEIIFQNVMNAGKVFVGFASLCVFLGCFYCCWVQYSDHKLKRSLKVVAKKIQEQQKTISKLKIGSKENKETGKPERRNTVPEEIQVSVV